jgi:hypothetical protein
VNTDEARIVLRHRSLVARLPYGDQMVDAWANALCDVSELDATRAVTELANAGVKDIGIPEIRGFLRDKRAAERREGQARMSIDTGCGCTLYLLCDSHRAIGLAQIRQIRQQRPTQRRWRYGKEIEGV